MTPADLQHWLAEQSLSQRKAALALAVSQDRLRRWLSGAQPIPKHISLACAALAVGLPEWPGRAS